MTLTVSLTPAVAVFFSIGFSDFFSFCKSVVLAIRVVVL